MSDMLLCRLGPHMTTHRVLLDVVTACGAVIGPSWDKFRAPYEQVGCKVCREATEAVREASREEGRLVFKGQPALRSGVRPSVSAAGRSSSGGAK